ncbi:MAG TPA: EcsC family protein [Candidatus Ozemobacteraceae bacterium]|nr:EcsC family protein [Candidatus Ozemobacteraceae bacterium]HQG27657.1 EcsC family protein [Candidatus Ozemobacteraceae bacterium]
MEHMNEGMLCRVLNWSYEMALDPGVPGVDSAYDLARHYSCGSRGLAENVDSLIRWQNARAGTSGFVTGLGGIITLPAAVPANISSVLFFQVRMIAAIAIMGGLDPRQDQVKTLVFVCLCGAEAGQILKSLGIELGKKLTVEAIRRISKEILIQINRTVGFRLMTKFGKRGLLNLGKAVPLIGGLIGGVCDLVSTDLIGGVAKRAFLQPPIPCLFAC